MTNHESLLSNGELGFSISTLVPYMYMTCPFMVSFNKCYTISMMIFSRGIWYGLELREILPSTGSLNSISYLILQFQRKQCKTGCFQHNSATSCYDHPCANWSRILCAQVLCGMVCPRAKGVLWYIPHVPQN